MIKIGTRGSPLALIQAELVKKELMTKAGLEPDEIDIIPYTTSGDRIKEERLIEFGGKGLFTKEIEQALIDGEVDIAVHSMKDVETKQPAGLIIPCCLEREDVRDAWVSPLAKHPKDLPPGAKVGTASLRRGAQILHINPNVEIVPLRGNVQTRLSKLQEGQAAGTILAMAGLNRLNMAYEATRIMEVEEMLPAPAQGALGLQCRDDNLEILNVLSLLNHQETLSCIEIERAFLSFLDGSCRTPIAAFARLEGNLCHFSGYISDPEGKTVLTKSFKAHQNEMKQKVEELANNWRHEYGAKLFGRTYQA